MSEVTHQPCPICDSSDAFAYNTESGMFKCYSCHETSGTKKSRCYDGKELIPFSKSDYQKEEPGMALEPYIPDSMRGISKSTLNDGLFYMTKSDKGEIANFSYPDGTKYRNLYLDKKDKYHFQISGKMDRLMGVDENPPSGKFITITEGEWDRYSVMEMLGDWPVYNTPNATPSKDFWANTYRDLKDYEGKIILSVDKDPSGDALAEKFYRLFPGRIYRVDHGKYKDANEFLQARDTYGYKKAWWSAKRVKPETILSTEEDFLDLYHNTPNYEYFPTGIDGLDDKMLGIHKGSTTMILAPTGIGKTEFMRYLEYKCYSTTDYNIAFCHLEETDLRSMLGLVSYELQDNLTRKDLIDEKGREQEVLQVLSDFGKSERLHELIIRAEDTMDDLIAQIRFLQSAMGVDYVFFEPIQDLVYGDTSTKESLLTDLGNKLKLLAPEINVGIVFIAHANEEGNPKYCNSLVQGAAYEIVLSRDVDAEDATERNTTYITVGRKNRTGGGNGPAGSVVFDKNTYMIEPSIGSVEPVFDKTDTSKVVGF